MLLPLYARGILKWSKSIYGLIMLVLLWTVYSSIIQMALNGKSNIPEYMIASATLLSWLGIRGVAGFAWVIAFSACILSLITSNAAMGGLGFLFLVTAFLGCVLHTGLGPAQFMHEVRQEFHGFSHETVQRISEDVKAAGDLAEGL
ncbi:hypothetical protein [Paracoccus aminovorans]|uniref:hypothetical protein n=1 Tax=Paracoccus aminovorans TaxID=34004 RepID=UPI002B26216F|nr:hypothetical protein [Paracoccus aminovorans]